MEQMIFETRIDFRGWLEENATTSKGIWLVFSKHSSIKTLKASEALEEALCYGWIDGQMRGSILMQNLRMLKREDLIKS